MESTVPFLREMFLVAPNRGEIHVKRIGCISGGYDFQVDSKTQPPDDKLGVMKRGRYIPNNLSTGLYFGRDILSRSHHPVINQRGIM